MATHNPPLRAVAYEIYVSLRSQANTKIFQANPTLASGDAKVSKDGGALANLTTLPTVTPAAGKMVKISLSGTEMTADDVTVVLSDAAGNEWCDLVLNIQTVDGALPADMVEISGDSGAADSLETMLDGTGGNVLKLKQLLIVATSNDSAIDVTGAGTGSGIKATGGTSSGHGILHIFNEDQLERKVDSERSSC